VRRETILAIEKERYGPSLELAHKIAKFLGTTLDELYLFEEDE
jgi:putative transcriptional regulator